MLRISSLLSAPPSPPHSTPRPNHRTFAMVIRACRTPSHASLAFDLYERLLRARRLGRHGDGAVVLGPMLKQQLDGGVGAEAMGATAARAVAAGIALNAVHHNVILAAVSRQESYARAAAYADALGPGLRDRVTHETLINAAGAEGRVAEAEGHVGEIVAMGKVRLRGTWRWLHTCGAVGWGDWKHGRSTDGAVL